MDSSVSPKDEIWFLRVCHHISNAVYSLYRRQGELPGPVCTGAEKSRPLTGIRSPDRPSLSESPDLSLEMYVEAYTTDFDSTSKGILATMALLSSGRLTSTLGTFGAESGGVA